MSTRTLLFLAGSFAVAASAALGNPASPAANGRAIFLTGRDLAGHRIAAVPRPLYPACVACHRASGAGGVHLPGGAVSADLRHRTLAHLKPAYTPALLERAISTGIDNEGKPLGHVMPRWRMSKADLHDVAAYVWTTLK